MNKPLNPVWDLDCYFPGGSESKQFLAFLDDLKERAVSFRSRLEKAASPQSLEDAESYADLVHEFQAIFNGIFEGESFTGCLAAQDQADRKAVALGNHVQDISAVYQSAMSLLDRFLSGIPDDVFAALLKQAPWSDAAFYLNERRFLSKDKMSPELESLASELAVDGYHGWGELYNTAVGKIQIPFEEDGKTELLSAGQAFNKLHSPDRETRVELFKRWEAAWEDQADFCADALNHLAGFRLRLYKQRGWDSVHKEPLAINRMTKETLDTMWGTVEKNKDIFVRFLERKAKLLGVDRLAWHDIDAPIGKAEKKLSYEEGAELIIEQFRSFSPKMADFAKYALENRWIEVEDRPGKQPGGFCTPFPIEEESRIFMTYSGTSDNVSTLAHELGHAFHDDVMKGMPPIAKHYAMNVAETASTLAETILSDAAIKAETDKEAKISLLSDKIQNAIAMFMNIHARFLFETNFYAERENGLVSIERLNELMVEAQKQAYRDSLSEYHPHFWAAKLHFYATDVPFYNFPYTFGLLFSSGIYQTAQQEGEGFEDRYIALLRDTASMTVEELASKHLGVNLEQPDFWQRAIDLYVADVNQFLELTED
ncbi:M3 family oligoendopeptidase [Gorillibacterium timonense]|uniref:M3 family oligoendopeptidase n=1 Tax=Gorillibacterium timonense TaxID=1689269 RepID=UPI00071C4E57|nr:M3 family oligoendopeptidase [Gorillibacterium timonense]